jgi:hypothetical protein
MRGLFVLVVVSSFFPGPFTRARGPDLRISRDRRLTHSVSKNSRRGLVGPDGMLPSQGKGLSYLSAFHSVLPESIRTCIQTMTVRRGRLRANHPCKRP